MSDDSCCGVRNAVVRFPLWSAAAPALLATVCLSGCGGVARVGGKPVTGTVTYRGSAVEGAAITFASPTASGYGSTDKEGHFKLRTAQGEGVPVGNYQVTITKTSFQPSGKVAASETEYVPPDPDAPLPTPEDLLPAKYKTAATSGLTATVSERGPNDFTFPLAD